MFIYFYISIFLVVQQHFANRELKMIAQMELIQIYI